MRRPRRCPPGLAAGEFRIVGRPAVGATPRSPLSRPRRWPEAAGGVPVTGFSLADLHGARARADRAARSAQPLHDAGLEAIAEVPLDLPRRAGAGGARGARRRAWRVRG